MAELSDGATPGEIVARDADRIQRLFAVAAGPVTWVFHDGVVYEIAEEAPARTRSGGHESLSAPMPATVVKVNVEAGARVAKGDILLLLEAMKMELPVRAPSDGVVTAVHCRAGELVQPGAPLIEIA
jgi:biotin carboxyl carrier protein